MRLVFQIEATIQLNQNISKIRNNYSKRNLIVPHRKGIKNSNISIGEQQWGA